MRSAALTLALLVVLAGFAPVAAATPPIDGEESATAARVGPEQPAASPEVSPPAAVSSPVVASLPPVESSSAAVSSAGALDARTDVLIRLQRDSDARWQVSVRYPIESENQTRAFHRIGRAFENESGVGPDAAIFRQAARRAGAASDREMRIENVSRNYALENGTGTLTLSFTWTRFTEQTDTGGLRLDDVFRTPGNETWLASLETDQELRIRTPPGYTITRNPGLPRRGDTIVVTGMTLQSRRPTIEYSRSRPTDTETPTPTDPNPVDIGAIGGVALAAVVVVLLIGWRRQQATADDGPSGAAAGGTSDGPGGGSAGSETATETATEAGGDAADGPEAAPMAGPDRAESDEGTDSVDPSLLSDEERVEHLLERNGGRMKQAHIVRETGWSDAKVSQLLSAMADEGRVDKLRLGRENLISLPDGEEHEE